MFRVFSLDAVSNLLDDRRVINHQIFADQPPEILPFLFPSYAPPFPTVSSSEERVYSDSMDNTATLQRAATLDCDVDPFYNLQPKRPKHGTTEIRWLSSRLYTRLEWEKSTRLDPTKNCSARGVNMIRAQIRAQLGYYFIVCSWMGFPHQPPSAWDPKFQWECFPYQPPILQGLGARFPEIPRNSKLTSSRFSKLYSSTFNDTFNEIWRRQQHAVTLSYLPGVDGAANVASLSDPISCKCHHNDQTLKNMFSKKPGWSFKCNKYIIEYIYI